MPPDLVNALSKFETEGKEVTIEDVVRAADKWNASKGSHTSFPLDAFPDDLQSTLKAFDQDGDGTVSKPELAAAAKMYQESKQQVRQMTKVIVALSAVMLFMLAAIMGLMFMVVDMSKETSTASNGVMTVKGDPTKVVRSDAVESFSSVWDIPAYTTDTLSYMKHVTLYVKMPEFMAEATFKVSVAYKPVGSKNMTFLTTYEGYTIAIDRVGRNGSIKMGNDGTFSVYLDLDSYDGGRRLDSAPLQDAALDRMEPALLSRESFFGLDHAEGRSLNAFGGALMTSGAFTMSASSQIY